MGTQCVACFRGKMLAIILLLNLILCISDAKSSPKSGLEDLENLVEKLESRLRDMETRLEETERRLESKDKEMERMEQNNQDMKTRLEELEDKMRNENDELEKKKEGMKKLTSKLKMEVEESSRKEIASNLPNPALTVTKPSPRDLPIVVISASQSSRISSPQTVTFDSFLANFNGDLDLDSGIFTCFTPGFYTVSFSAYCQIGTNLDLYLYKNGSELAERKAVLGQRPNALNANIWVTVSRILILHMDVGDTLELRMARGDWVQGITLNIELIGGEEFVLSFS